MTPRRLAVPLCLLLALSGCDEPSDEPLDGASVAEEGQPSAPEVDGGTVLPGTSAGTSAGTAPVDCAATLPCRATLDDGALAVTVAAADGEALDGSGALRVDFAVEAVSRDTTLSLGPASSAVVAGQVLAAESVAFGASAAATARDEASRPLVAGLPINARVVFDGRPLGNPATLDRLILALAEDETPRPVRFANVPLGPAPGDPVDCADTLPCVWRATDGGAALTLVEVAPARWNRATRLVVAWTLEASRALETLALPGGLALTAGGETLEPYGIELGGIESRDGTPLDATLDAGARIDGLLVMRRLPADAGERTLARVELPVVERRALRAPRWRPVFLRVPIVAADAGMTRGSVRLPP